MLKKLKRVVNFYVAQIGSLSQQINLTICKTQLNMRQLTSKFMLFWEVALLPVLFFRHFTGNCLQRIAGFWSWAHFAPKLGHFCPKVRLISSWSLAILLKFKQIIANIEEKIAGFWSWANFAPKLGHFCPEVRLILPLKLGSKCWKNNTGYCYQFMFSRWSRLI